MNNPLSGTDPTGYTSCQTTDSCPKVVESTEEKGPSTRQSASEKRAESATRYGGNETSAKAGGNGVGMSKATANAYKAAANGAKGQGTTDARTSATSASSGSSAYPLALVIPVPRFKDLPPAPIPGEMPANANDSAEPITLGEVIVREIEEELNKPIIYITYILTKSNNGAIVKYYGRTSGRGTPTEIMMKRFSKHWLRRFQGFGDPKLDEDGVGNEGYLAIRGREQQLIDRGGGVDSDNVGNLIRGVSKSNKRGRIYHEASNAEFGNIHAYTGDN